MSVQQSALAVFVAVWAGSLLSVWLAGRQVRRYLNASATARQETAAAWDPFAELDGAYRTRLQDWALAGRQVQSARWEQTGQLRLLFDDTTVLVLDEAVLSLDTVDPEVLVGAVTVSVSVRTGVTAVLLASPSGAVVAAGRLLSPERMLTHP